MGKPVGVREPTFDAEVLPADLPALADIWATWCAPGAASVGRNSIGPQEYRRRGRRL